MKKVTQKQAKLIADKFGINLNVVDIKDFTFGLNVELEHGKKFGAITNVTNDNIMLTAKIVIAHLLESLDYYKRLEKMELKAEKYWKNKKKKNIFL